MSVSLPFFDGSVRLKTMVSFAPWYEADIYLDSNRSSGGLYHEEYTSTAVMFASIPNYTDFRAGSDDIDGENDGIRHLSSSTISSENLMRYYIFQS